MLKSLRVSVLLTLVVVFTLLTAGYFFGVSAGQAQGKANTVPLKMSQNVALDSYNSGYSKGFEAGVDAANTIKVLSRINSGERELVGEAVTLTVEYVAQAFSQELGEDGTEYGVKILFESDFGCASIIIPGYPTADAAVEAAQGYATTWDGWRGLCD
jgi:hypothetical protein